MKKRMKHGNRKFSKSSFSRACLFLLPSLISVLVLFVMPYLDVIRRSFLDGTGQRFVGMENYKSQEVGDGGDHGGDGCRA